MRRMVNHVAITVREFADGEVEVTKQTLDQATRRVVPVTLFKTKHPDEGPWTVAELLLIGAAEMLARENGLEYPLPF